LSLETSKLVGNAILEPFDKNQIDAIYLVYNEFKSALSQNLVVERLLPVAQPAANAEGDRESETGRAAECCSGTWCRCTSTSRSCARSTSRWRASSAPG
jgi:F0F1-type ATP synthase gamma subunit